jgi:hypothetical protein
MLVSTRFLVLCVFLVSLSRPAEAQTLPSDFGMFLDPLRVELDPAGFRMILQNDYGFRDPAGKIWVAKKGSTVDGASIPQVFWSIIGGPLDGPFRNASVIHDYFCVTRTETWQATDKVFYNGMRANGVGEAKALAMYYAVLAFGPRWGLRSLNKSVCSEKNGKIVCGIIVVNDEQRVDIPTTPEDLADVEALEKKLEAGDKISVPDIERMALDKGNPRFPTELRK